ncbi:MAG: hypothetical protein JO359_00350 [Candidatus Eremiobacteraeota bacterium]|nr:hypothetical protein [Candidatus Eremiobacteraeota bacterium]
MKAQARRELIFIDLVGELDTAMSQMLARELRALAEDAARGAAIVVRLEGLDSTQWAGLCELASAIEKYRHQGFDVRAHSRLQRVRAVLDEFAIPTDVPGPELTQRRRRIIIARTPKPHVA